MNDYSGYEDEPSDSLAEKLEALANHQQAIEDMIEEAEQRLVELKLQLRIVSEQEIPELLRGMKGSLTLPDGRKIIVNKKIRAHVSKEHMPAAVSWLDDHKFGIIVKREVSARFDRATSNSEIVEKAVKMLELLGVQPEVKLNIHHMTLTSFVSEKMKNGVDIPKDLFGVQEINQTVIK